MFFPDIGEPVCCDLHRLFPAGLAEILVHFVWPDLDITALGCVVTADQWHGETIRVMDIAHPETTLDA